MLYCVSIFIKIVEPKMEKKKLNDIYLDDKITKEAYDDKYSEISNGKITGLMFFWNRWLLSLLCSKL